MAEREEPVGNFTDEQNQEIAESIALARRYGVTLRLSDFHVTPDGSVAVSAEPDGEFGY